MPEDQPQPESRTAQPRSPVAGDGALSERCAAPADLHTIAGWIDSARACELWAGQSVGYPIDRARLRKELAFDHAHSRCLTHGDTLLAFGQFLPRPRGRAHLARLIVNPGFRGHGLGLALLRCLLRAARDGGHHLVSLKVDPENGPALGLYRKLGFVTAAQPPDEPGPSALYMECDIRAAMGD